MRIFAQTCLVADFSTGGMEPGLWGEQTVAAFDKAEVTDYNRSYLLRNVASHPKCESQMCFRCGLVKTVTQLGAGVDPNRVPTPLHRLPAWSESLRTLEL